MGRRKNHPSRRKDARPILSTAIGLIGFGSLFLVMSWVMGANSSPVLRAFAQGIRSPVPYLFGLGFVTLAIHFIVARLASAPLPKIVEPLTSPPSTRGDPASTMERPWTPPASIAELVATPHPPAPASACEQKIRCAR